MTSQLNLLTVHQAFEIYSDISRRRRPLRPVTIKDTEYVLTHYASALWDRPIASITPQECADLFVRLTRIGPATADKTLGRLQTVMNIARRACESESDADPLPDGNPVTRMRRGTPRHRQTVRARIIPADRVRALWRSLKRLGEHTGQRSARRTAADLLRLRLMTAMRINESRQLRYSHIDWESGWIHVPGTLRKNARDLHLPMAPEVHELLARRYALHRARYPQPNAAPDAFVFESVSSPDRPIMRARATLKSVAGTEIAECDLRRLFVAIACTCGVDPDVRSRLLGLVPQDVRIRHFRQFSHGELLDALSRVIRWLDHEDTGPTHPAEDIGIPPGLHF